ncbi:MAG: zf-HC2 domain-containing protein [Actinomycetia bacterium]|nr:zf-HC2 domain-containing protein [Actinomycetes bacterium]
MDCEYIRNLISEYIDNELPISQKKEVEDHLAICSSCKKYFDEIIEVKELLTSATFYDLSFERSKKLLKLVREKSTEMLPVLKPKPVWAKWQFVSVISVLVILLLGVLTLQIFRPFLMPTEKAIREVEMVEDLEERATTAEEAPLEERVGVISSETEEYTEIEGEVKEIELITINPEVPPVPKPIATSSEKNYTSKDLEETFIKQKSDEGIIIEEIFELFAQIDLNQIPLIKDEYDRMLTRSAESNIEQIQDFGEVLQELEPKIYKYLTGLEQLPKKFPQLYFYVEKAEFGEKDVFIIMGIGPGKGIERDEVGKIFLCVIDTITKEVIYLKSDYGNNP